MKFYCYVERTSRVRGIQTRTKNGEKIFISLRSSFITFTLLNAFYVIFVYIFDCIVFDSATVLMSIEHSTIFSCIFVVFFSLVFMMHK